MTSDERIRVGENWLGIAQMYGKEIPRQALSLMLNAISDLDPQAVIQAFEQWARTSRQNRHPLPADVRAIVAPEVDDESLAKDAASRICAAIAKYGWCNSKEAKAFMGSVGWAVVERNGGWQYICENYGLAINPTTFQAQARELAKTQIHLARSGRLNQAPELPSSNLAQLKSQEIDNPMSIMIKDLNDVIKHKQLQSQSEEITE